MIENREITAEILAFVEGNLDKPEITREDFMEGLNLNESEAEWMMEELFKKGLVTLKWLPVRGNKELQSIKGNN